MRRNRRKRRSRRNFFDRPLKASVAELTGWEPPNVEVQPRTQPRLPVPTTGTRRILAVLAALPKLAASVGFAIVGHPDAAIEVLPGEPAAVAFTAGGQLKGLFYLPTTEHEARKAIGLPAAEIRDRHADRLWEENRLESKTKRRDYA